MVPSITKRVLISGLALLILGVVGCTGLTRSKQPAVKTWLLQPYVAATPHPTDRPTRVRVTVGVIPGLDSDRILTFFMTAELNHYAEGRWPDNLPEMTASLVTRTLQKSGRFDVVSGRGGVRPDCNLHLLVEKFYAAIEPSGHAADVRIAVTGSYACQGREPETLDLSAAVPVDEPHMSGIVAAFQQGVDTVLEQLLQALQNGS